jgi:hypothetical protein
VVSIQDDPLYEELRDGYLTESADGASALWEILFLIIALPFRIVFGIVRWFRGRH